MDFVSHFVHLGIDAIVHIDQALLHFVAAYGAWAYLLLFAIVYTETGAVILPFLPGDSLLFIVGAMCGIGLLSRVFFWQLALGASESRNSHLGIDACARLACQLRGLEGRSR